MNAQTKPQRLVLKGRDLGEIVEHRVYMDTWNVWLVSGWTANDDAEADYIVSATRVVTKRVEPSLLAEHPSWQVVCCWEYWKPERAVDARACYDTLDRDEIERVEVTHVY